MKVEIYTDGGCRGNQEQDNIGAYAAVFQFGEHKKEIKQAVRNTTNNQMEIKAVVEALKEMKKTEYPVIVYSDYAYVVNCINDKWYQKWMSNGWLNAKKKPVENRELWIELLEQIEKFPFIEFKKVKGHSNDELNNRADALVNEAMNELGG